MTPANFAKTVKARLAQNELLFKSSAQVALQHVKDLQVEVQSAIQSAKGISVAHLNSIKNELDAVAAQFEKDLQGTVESMQNKSWNLGASSIPDSIHAVGIKTKFSMLPDKLLITAKDFSADLIKDLSKEIVDKISSDLRIAIVRGDNPYETMQRVQSHLFQKDEGAFYRAESIVRTENTRMFNIANQERLDQAKQILPKLKKIWVPSPEDGRNRLDHMKAGEDYGIGGDPGPIPIDQPFIVGGEELMFPGDPEGDPHQVVNCRCSSQPYMEEWKADEILTPEE